MAEDYLDAQKRQSEPYEKAALKAIEAGDYALASSFYQKAGQEDAARKCTYTLAEQLLSAKDWDAASAAFAACGDYLDAKQRIAEPYLIAGDTFLAENRYNEAIRMYEKAGDAGAVSIQNAYYVEAEALLLSKQWDEANRLFLKAGDYRDASVRAYAAFKEEGDLLLNEGKTAEAFEAYAKAGETGQSWIHAVHYNWAQEALQAGNWEESSREFQLAENYLDAQSRVYEPYYVHGKQLLEQKAYLSAAEAFVKAEDFTSITVLSPSEKTENVTLETTGFAAKQLSLKEEGLYVIAVTRRDAYSTSYRENGKIKHRTLKNFGLLDEDQVPFLKAMYAKKKPRLVYDDVDM
jgi:tetratricopeptide (TPR) repeat protein